MKPDLDTPPGDTNSNPVMQTLTFKATPADATAFRAAAKEKGVSFSSYVRDTLRTIHDMEARARKSKDIITPGRVIVTSSHPISDEVLYAAIHEY